MVISNTYAIFEVHFIKNLSNTEAELKKCVAYTKTCNIWFSGNQKKYNINNHCEKKQKKIVNILEINKLI